MAVVYADTGAPADETGSTNLSPQAPATVNAGDNLVCVIGHTNDATQVLATYTPPTGWTLTNSTTRNNTRQFTYEKDTVTGGEDGTSYTWTVSGGNSSASHNAWIHRFTGGSGKLKAFSAGVEIGDTTPKDADVTTTAPNDLAINFLIQAASVLGAEFSGETGGDWTLVYTYTVGPPRHMLHTAPMPSVGTIGGGSTTISPGTTWISHGYALAVATAASGQPASKRMGGVKFASAAGGAGVW